MSDYDRGLADGRAGLPPARDGNFEYDQGRIEADRQRSSGGAASGAGLGVLLLVVPLCFLYPCIGALVAPFAIWSLHGTTDRSVESVIAAMFLPAIAAVYFGARFERRASRFKLYRRLRDVWRWVFGIGLFIKYAGQTGWHAPSHTMMFLALIAVPLLYWTTKKADRVYEFDGSG
jgi:hypothetical protein